MAVGKGNSFIGECSELQLRAARNSNESRPPEDSPESRLAPDGKKPARPQGHAPALQA
jgi:hypothetical protein